MNMSNTYIVTTRTYKEYEIVIEAESEKQALAFSMPIVSAGIYNPNNTFTDWELDHLVTNEEEPISCRLATKEDLE
jgi:hypothetical protein